MKTIEIETLILEILQTSLPLSKTELAEKIRTFGQLNDSPQKKILKDMVEQGNIRSIKKRSMLYTNRDEKALILEAAQQTLQQGPQSLSGLKKSAAFKRLPSNKELLKTTLENLVKEGKLYHFSNKPIKYSLEPANAKQYGLEVALLTVTKLRNTIAKKKLSEQEVMQAFQNNIAFFYPQYQPKNSTTAVYIDLAPIKAKLKKLIEIPHPDTHAGASVATPQLRLRMPQEWQTRETFDAALLELAKEKYLVMQLHSYPGNISEKDEKLFLKDHKNNYYVAVELRTV